MKTELTRLKIKCTNCGIFNITVGRSVNCPQCGEFVTVVAHISGPKLCEHGFLPEWCEICISVADSGDGGR